MSNVHTSIPRPALVRQAEVSAGWLYFYEVMIPGGGRDAGDYHSSLYELQASELYVEQEQTDARRSHRVEEVLQILQ
jgi:hypothetical protein